MNTKALIVKIKISKLGQSEKDDELTDEIHQRSIEIVEQRLHGIGEDAGRYTTALYPRRLQGDRRHRGKGLPLPPQPARQVAHPQLARLDLPRSLR